jgi:hypothetical protein
MAPTEREMAEHRAKLAARDEKTAASGKKPGARTPAPPLEGPQPKPTRSRGSCRWRAEQCYNAQAGVAAESLLVIAVDVVQAPNDKQQIAPMLEKAAGWPWFGPGPSDSAAMAEPPWRADKMPGRSTRRIDDVASEPTTPHRAPRSACSQTG